MPISDFVPTFARKLTPVNLIFIGLLSFVSIGGAREESLKNQFKDHPAPYLALHGDDPVYWQNWDGAALEKAQKANKILFLSIGYFSCHWCHVMQQETYQDAAAAAYINKNFIPVKIDKELEPALDRRLMDFTQRIIGRGGWPLNVFVSPEGYPIYAVLYAPTNQFMDIASRIQSVWQADSDKVNEIIKNEVIERFDDSKPVLDSAKYYNIIQSAPDLILATADQLDGGFGEQQKFPSAPQLEFLLARFQKSGNSEVSEFLELTLASMANKGLYDHLAGGFFRYTVDPGWEIPHFEKMLYDNVNLAALYMQASKVLERPELLAIAQQTLNFMQSGMLHTDGALISSFSAVDEDNIEGGHYLWTKEQLASALNAEQLNLITNVWGMDRNADLPGGNHPRFEKSLRQFAHEAKKPVDNVRQVYESARKQLLKIRDSRPLPRDDKLVTGWNALALILFIEAAKAFDSSDYEDTAKSIHDFLVNRMWNGEQLARSMAKGNIVGSASLEDYAYTAQALYAWSQFENSQADAKLAKTIVDLAWSRFHRGNGWFQDDGSLIAAVSGDEMIADAATLSPSAALISVSLKIAADFSDSELRDQALSALNRGEQYLQAAPFWYVGQLGAIDHALSASK